MFNSNNVTEMDLFETILRTAGAEKYLNNFKENEIEEDALKLLSDEDLKLIGVEEEEIRANIIKKAQNLQLNIEKKQPGNIDADYAERILQEINNQLNKNKANIFCGLKRKDIILCDVKLATACKTLQNCLNSFEAELDTFERKIIRKKQKKKNYVLYSLSLSVILLITSSIVYSFNK